MAPGYILTILAVRAKVHGARERKQKALKRPWRGEGSLAMVDASQAL
jgi:hypothetical protein